MYYSYCFITSVNCWYIYPTKISLIVHKSSIMQPIDTARATKIKYLFPYLVAFSLFGQNHNQRIAPTLINKSHPFRHTQIGRLISQIQLQNPSLRIWMLPNQFQSDVSANCTKAIEKFYLLIGEEIEVKKSLMGISFSQFEYTFQW